jgi:alpha-beta hydrolase superfamily lysophospholipase
MSHQVDYSQLDQPQILGFVFYPRIDWTPPPPGATDHLVSVADDVSISCRFYPVNDSAPNILFFHGNGEVIYDYDDIAQLYNRVGINLFVADYRGYGQSGGRPSFSNTVSDAPVILNYFRDTLQGSGYGGSLFVMGRSLGSLSSVELAANNSQHITGLIIESGFASAGRFFRYSPSVFGSVQLEAFEKANLDKIQSITIPVLIIHGDYDEIVPYEQAVIFYENAGTQDKRLLTISGAGHNDIILIGMQEYFSTIKEFVFSHSG